MLNKLDILSGVDPIRLCVAYEIDGRRVEAWPSSAELARARLPRLRVVRRLGASRSTPSASLSDLPEAARRYVTALEEHAGRADRARLGRAGANPDDRAGLAADAPSSGGGRMSGGCSLVQPTRILIVGGGGREHALAWKLAAEPGVNEVLVAPGIRRDRDGAAGPRARRRRSARRSRPSSRSPGAFAAELVVIGPEAPLAAGVADALADAGFAVFGPSAAAARIESSQGVLPGGRRGGGCPDGARPGVRPDGPVGGLAYAMGLAADGRVVVKADGLAAGKGVTVCDSLDEAAEAISAQPGRVRRRGAARPAARRASSRSATADAPSPCRSRATTSGSATATRARTRAGWAPSRRSPDLPDDDADDDPRPVPPAGPRRARPARDAVPRRALCRA